MNALIRLGRVERRYVEMAFTVLCLLFLILSWLVGRFEWGGRLELSLNLAAYFTGGWFGTLTALGELRQRKMNVDVLMILAALGAACIDQWHEGATLLFLFSLSNTLQEVAMDRSRRAVEKLLDARPSVVSVLRAGEEVRIAIAEVRPGDQMLVRPGEMLVCDGTLARGATQMNEASITGESRPVEKGEGAEVFAGAVNGSGSVEVTVSRPPEESTLARIVRLVESAQSERSRTQRLLDEIESYYAWTITAGAAGFILVPWLLMGWPFEETFYKGMVLLVVASPCALVISTPAATLSALACGARHGILFKGGAHLENLADVKVAAFDKTGTLTHGEMALTDLVPGEGFDRHDLLQWAASIEAPSEHPIAQAIVRAAKGEGVDVLPAQKFINLTGRGAQAKINGFLCWIGGSRLFEDHGEAIPEALLEARDRMEAEGKTVLILHRELGREGNVGFHERHGGWVGAVAVADTPREDAPAVVRALQARGIREVVMLTGDNPATAAEIARVTGVTRFEARLLPEEKVTAIRQLQQQFGPVVMVGDGVNDAPALAHAQVGIAMGGAGADVALDTADAVLMGDDIARLPFAVKLSQRAMGIIKMNLAFSLAVIALLVAAVFLFDLPLTIGVLGHEGSTVLVVLNGLRLLRTREEPLDA